MTDLKPFQVLQHLSDVYAANAKPLPAEKEEIETRTIVCFSILGNNMAVSLEEVTEILERQHCTLLPRVKRWVKGLANVRGRLLPVIDFAEFLQGSLSSHPKHQRILVLETGGLYVGLQVDQVYGMEHFPVHNYVSQAKNIPEVLADCIQGSFVVDGEEWPLLRPPYLINNEKFMNVAA